MKYCLIGEKLSHSYSKEIHQKNGFDYTLNEVEKQDLSSFVKDNSFDGYNVTIPYKSQIIEYLDEVSDLAKQIGSVNTVVKKNGKNVGYNTDYAGFSFALKHNNIRVKNKVVTILGSGGTAKTIEYYCRHNGAKTINIVSRQGEVSYQNVYERCLDTEILINATPVGTSPNIQDKIVDLEKFKSLQFVFDCIYNPLKTRLLLDAEKVKIKNANGLLMLTAQAFYSEQIWQGKTIENKKILDSYYELFKDKSNIILYGMTSAGKTTLGGDVAQKLKREFFDSDIEFEKAYLTSPSEYIKRYGEESFREKESEIVKQLSIKTGVVIVVGGGATLKEENVSNLKQNGILIQVKRKLKFLSQENRPILEQYGAKQLYSKRKKVYNSASRICVSNNKHIYNGVKKVIRKYENTCDKWCKS